MVKKQLLAACALSALAFAFPASAYAQDAAGAQTDTTEADQTAVAQTDNVQAAAAQPGVDTAPDTSNDIVVTAQGRAQQLSKVPLAISAISSEQLEASGVTDVRQLNQVAPSLLVSSTGNEANGSARIRGVGTVGDNPGLESSVALFIDGVYRSRTGIGLDELGDLERIEVLRGPQGTLFGRNASAGIINIVSKSPTFDFGAGGEVSYGNYDQFRVAGNVNVPLSQTIAARVDGVYVRRDGFYNDVINGGKVNNKDRYFIRGQLLFQPSSDLTVRLIGDYAKKNEACCAAVYIDQTVAPQNRNLLTTQNPIIPVLLDFGQPAASFSNPYSRDIYSTPGRSFDGQTQDWGVSGQIDYDLGTAHVTSITAYRDYYNQQASDTDYSVVDILFRAPGPNAGRREFKTFSQELRLQGQAFGGHLDWLIGGYYSNEKLSLRENLSFGSQYGIFSACRLLATVSPAIPRNINQSGCRAGPGGAVTDAVLGGIFGPVGGATLSNGLQTLSTLANVGNQPGTEYRQKTSDFAAFTHNIISITDQLKLTLGLRYTHETKDFDADFANNNTVCPALQAQLLPTLLSGTSTVPASLLGGILTLGCLGNSTAEINGQSINDKRTEDQVTGTAILSYQLTPDLLAYGSYSRGYKAGGFNLDASALKQPLLPFAVAGSPQSLVGNLEFDPEINHAIEIGVKYSTPKFSLSVTGFRQLFENFQLNTFNGQVFLVQTINSCGTGLNGADRDLSATTGACAPGDVRSGVVSQGVELESSIIPARDFRVGLGFTFADTHFRNDLIGNRLGTPLDPALNQLPGQDLSNAPETVATGSLSWTPPIGDTGFSGLFYIDGRLSSDYNTGSDLFPQKGQDSFFIANARIGLRAPDDRFSLEFWVQNLFDKDYTQVAFNSPVQAGGAGPAGVFPVAQYPGGTQIFSAFLAEPRTYGVTLRGKF